MRSNNRRAREGHCSACLRCMLMLFNFLLSFVGVALVLYSLWVLHTLPTSSSFRILPSQDPPGASNLNFGAWNLPPAWFVYFLLGLGVIICIITLFGHFAAEVANGCCLSCYAFLVVLLILLQGAFVTDVFLNKNWDEDIPNDPTGLFEYIKQFVGKNLDVCKWAGLAIVVTEAFAALLALCVRAMQPSSCGGSYDSDDEYAEYALHRSVVRQPLLSQRRGNATIPIRGTVEGFPYQTDSSSTRMRDISYVGRVDVEKAYKILSVEG